jgi:hypothetical protein
MSRFCSFIGAYVLLVSQHRETPVFEPEIQGIRSTDQMTSNTQIKACNPFYNLKNSKVDTEVGVYKGEP